MGIDYKAYVGPYIKVYNPLKNSVGKYHTCVNPKCSNHKKEVSSEYCEKCGKKIGLLERDCQERIDFEYWDEFDGIIAEAIPEFKPDEIENYRFFIPNTGKIGLHLDAKYVSVNPIDCGKPIMDVNNFQLSFKKQIARIKKVFGKDAVTIEWGVLVWQS